MFLLVLFMFFSVSFSHDVMYKVEENKAVVVKVFFSDGTEIAYAPYEIFSPSDSKIPWQKGRTDRKGYLSFYPSESGTWRIKLTEESGHGIEIKLNISGQGDEVENSNDYACSPHVKLLSYVGLFFLVMLSFYTLKKLNSERKKS